MKPLEFWNVFFVESKAMREEIWRLALGKKKVALLMAGKLKVTDLGSREIGKLLRMKAISPAQLEKLGCTLIKTTTGAIGTKKPAETIFHDQSSVYRRRATTAEASTAAVGVKITEKPRVDSSHAPRKPRRPKSTTRKYPTTVGGKTRGNSTSPSTRALPG